MNFDKRYFAELLTLAKGDRSINQYGIDAGVDPGYISRLLRGLVDNAPGATVIKKLADAARSSVSAQEMLAAAGYLDTSGSGVAHNIDMPYFQQWQQWEKVIEEAARYNISPDAAVDLIHSMGKSMKRINKGNASE